MNSPTPPPADIEAITPHKFDLVEWTKFAREFVDAGRAAMKRVAERGHDKDELKSAMEEMHRASRQLHGIIGFDPIDNILKLLSTQGAGVTAERPIQDAYAHCPNCGRHVHWRFDHSETLQADSCPPRRRDDAGTGEGNVLSLPPVGIPQAGVTALKALAQTLREDGDYHGDKWMFKVADKLDAILALKPAGDGEVERLRADYEERGRILTGTVADWAREKRRAETAEASLKDLRQALTAEAMRATILQAECATAEAALTTAMLGYESEARAHDASRAALALAQAQVGELGTAALAVVRGLQKMYDGQDAEMKATGGCGSIHRDIFECDVDALNDALIKSGVATEQTPAK